MASSSSSTVHALDVHYQGTLAAITAVNRALAAACADTRQAIDVVCARARAKEAVQQAREERLAAYEAHAAAAAVASDPMTRRLEAALALARRAVVPPDAPAASSPARSAAGTTSPLPGTAAAAVEPPELPHSRDGEPHLETTLRLPSSLRAALRAHAAAQRALRGGRPGSGAERDGISDATAAGRLFMAQLNAACMDVQAARGAHHDQQKQHQQRVYTGPSTRAVRVAALDCGGLLQRLAQHTVALNSYMRQAFDSGGAAGSVDAWKAKAEARWHKLEAARAAMHNSKSDAAVPADARAALRLQFHKQAVAFIKLLFPMWYAKGLVQQRHKHIAAHYDAVRHALQQPALIARAHAAQERLQEAAAQSLLHTPAARPVSSQVDTAPAHAREAGSAALTADMHKPFQTVHSAALQQWTTQVATGFLEEGSGTGAASPASGAQSAERVCATMQCRTHATLMPLLRQLQAVAVTEAGAHGRAPVRRTGSRSPQRDSLQSFLRLWRLAHSLLCHNGQRVCKFVAVVAPVAPAA